MSNQVKFAKGRTIYFVEPRCDNPSDLQIRVRLTATLSYMIASLKAKITHVGNLIEKLDSLVNGGKPISR